MLKSWRLRRARDVLGETAVRKSDGGLVEEAGRTIGLQCSSNLYRGKREAEEVGLEKS